MVGGNGSGKDRSPDETTSRPIVSGEDRLANLRFLYSEAKKMYLTVNDYKQFNGEPLFLNQLTDQRCAEVSLHKTIGGLVCV